MKKELVEKIEVAKKAIACLCAGFVKLFNPLNKTCIDCEKACPKDYAECKRLYLELFAAADVKAAPKTRNTSEGVVPEFCKLFLQTGKVNKKEFTTELEKSFAFVPSTLNHIACDLTILLSVMQESGYKIIAPAPAAAPTPAPAAAPTRRRPAAAV